MQRNNPILHLIWMLCLVALSQSAQAALSVERSVTVTDDHGGTLVMISSGSRDALGGESTTTASFTAFQPSADRRRVDGEVVRSRVRSADTVETAYDGTLEIATPAGSTAPDRLDTLVFQGLTVTRTGDGPVLSGSILFNGKQIDAGALPPKARRLLARTLRFFQFA